MSAKPTTILIATDEDKDKQIAKLKAQHEEDEKNMKAQEKEKEDMEAKIANLEVKETTPGPVVKAIIAMMDDEHKKEAKKAFLKAMDEEHDEDKKTAMKKAMEEIFDTGNGTNTNAQDDEKKKEQDAVIASLSAKLALPIIDKILVAKRISGASEKDIEDEKTRLVALKFPELEKEYQSQEIFINSALKGKMKLEQGDSLTAAFEKELEFNGEHGFALTGKAVDLDEAIEEAAVSQ